jgi:membrane-associated phospholipid phosphatase
MVGLTRPPGTKFFASFFQKRSAFLVPFATVLAIAPAAYAQPHSGALSPANSAEMQALLKAQIGKLPVRFSNQKLPRIAVSTYDRLFLWNEIGLDTTAIDHTPVPPGETRIFGEQFGPARSSRAMAIPAIAMFEAVNSVYQRYHSYTGLAPIAGEVSLDYALARAAHDTLVWLYPSQSPRLDALFRADAGLISGNSAALQAGNAMGIAAAQSIIALRTNDGAQVPDPRVGVNYFPKVGPGYWSPDPISGSQLALGAYWGQVKPFVMQAGNQFRPATPPGLTSQEYTKNFRRTARLGGDPKNGTPTQRDARQTLMGIYWTYDGTPALCAPPRLYNQVARTLAFQQGVDNVEDAARFLALANTAMADAAIAAWDAKWFYQYWRPVTAIRNAASAGNPNTPQNPTWYPLGAQATNTHGPNFTPPFPSYPSGHATFGGALFEIFRHYWPDATPFTFTSDEFNGQNYDIYGNLLPLHPLSYRSFTDAEYDNAESRIWIGVHWQFDADIGIQQGRQVADYVFANAFQPVTNAPRHLGIAAHGE